MPTTSDPTSALVFKRRSNQFVIGYGHVVFGPSTKINTLGLLRILRSSLGSCHFKSDMNYHKMQLLAYLLLMPTISLAFERTYNITNNCPSAINLYVNGVFDSVMPKDGQITKIFDNAQAESFYTDANGGSANDVGSTTAGFGGVSSFVSSGRIPAYLHGLQGSLLLYCR